MSGEIGKPKSWALRFGRIVFAAVVGAFSGTICLTLTEGLLLHKQTLSLTAIGIASAMNLLSISAVLLAIGLPTYLISRLFPLKRKIAGIIFGFALGMLGGVGYGMDFIWKNLVFGAATFGLSGIITATVFLWISERD